MGGSDEGKVETTRPVVQNFEPAKRHVGTGPDSDGDGLSDDFESNVFHSDPNSADKDGDGLSDWSEYWVDTNPNNDDTDNDGFLDGEDLAFGDPLAVDPGGDARRELREKARAQFDAEGSDKDHDWLRDHVEAGEGTSAANPDSDGDGLADGVEVQMRTHGITTSQHSTADDTTDLDAAREMLGERRWAAEQQRLQQQSGTPSSSLEEPADDGQLVAGGGDPDAFDPNELEQQVFDEPPAADPMVADAGVAEPDGSFEA